MLGAQLGLTLLLLVACSFAPGFFFVRKFPWNPLEKLCGSIALSLVFIYLASFGAYVFAPAWFSSICRAFAALSILLFLWTWKDIRRLACSFGARQALLGYGFLLLWTLAVLAMVRSYSGALWAADWAEHFQRTLFFLHRFPPHLLILGGYKLPARPPLMNLLGAFFLAQTADRYEIFQLIFVFLNSLLFLACCLTMRRLVKRRKLRVLPLAALFALNPVIMQNATYTWTKELTAFFVVFAIGLYLAGIGRNDGTRLVAAFAALAAGLLVHYSAGPYVLFLALHYLIRIFPTQPRKLRQLAAIVCVSGFLLATWFGWSAAVYGVHDTFASNTTVTSSEKYPGSNLAKIAENLFDSAVPAVVRQPDVLNMFDQPNPAGKLRDHVFVFYQTNFIFGMGLIGGPFALWLFLSAMRKSAGPERDFWLFFVPFVVLTGVAVVGERDALGVAHLTLIGIEALGITLVAASFPWRRGMAMLLIAGCVADFSLGVYLQALVESFDNTPRQTVFGGLIVADHHLQLGAMGPDSLSESAWRNWHLKNLEVLNADWLRLDRTLPQENPEVRKSMTFFQRNLASDAEEWQGWYARNGGAITFLGDHLAHPDFNGWTAPSTTLWLLFAGLLTVFWKNAMRRAPVTAAKPIPVRKRTARRR